MFKYSVLSNPLAVLEEGAALRHKPACWKQNQLDSGSWGISIAVGAPGAPCASQCTRENPGGPNLSDSLKVEGGEGREKGWWCRLPGKAKACFLQLSPSQVKPTLRMPRCN